MTLCGPLGHLQGHDEGKGRMSPNVPLSAASTAFDEDISRAPTIQPYEMSPPAHLYSSSSRILEPTSSSLGLPP